MNVLNILVSPVITEKSMADAENSKFTFIVSMDSDKPTIQKAVEAQFGVKVLDVATSIVKGKIKRVGKKRTEKKLNSIKKAIVTLEKGQKIDLFDLGDKK
ncbi:MAG TPA: 50S ribosomal protein L23 [Patescibacteria group bacterium]